ncbi:MAG: hypothetical protein KKB51_01555 [Candidatus Riflebacteria bacterium]|nr:hypothetical protein [Candidatus Riflebacteria bacterium]
MDYNPVPGGHALGESVIVIVWIFDAPDNRELMFYLTVDVEAVNHSDLAPGEFKPWLELEGEIFPSWILCPATMKSVLPEEPDQFGDPKGSIGIHVCSPEDDDGAFEKGGNADQ